jgi:hypothetical protein
MGMYDTITISPEKLPITPDERVLLSDEEFQTKDLFCYMNDYEITADGSLYLIREMIGCWKYKEVYERIIHTGEIRFYTTVGPEWFEFIATYVDGKLEKIERDKDNMKY